MRLIDADALLKVFEKYPNDMCTKNFVFDKISNAPTIEPIEDIKSCGVIEEEQNTLPSAEPSDDLVSRQLLLGAIEKCGEDKIYPQALIQTINALPSADTPHEYNLETIADIVRQLGHLDSYIADTCDRPKGEWTPISERLPEDLQRVLVTIVNYKGDRVVRVAEYYKWNGVFQIKENHEQWEVGEKGLLAWMPLPKPFERCGS